MKKIKLLLSFAFLMVICPISVSNAQTFDWSAVFSEYRHYKPPFTASDLYVMIAAANVDTISYPVYVQNIPPGAPGDTLLNNLLGWNDFNPYVFVKGFGSPAPGVDWENRTYTFYIDLIQNGQYDPSEPTTTWDIPLGSISQMALVQNVSISAGCNPTITWNSDPNADSYRVRFFPVKQNGNPNFSDLLFESDVFSGLSSYSFTYLGDLFNTYDFIAVVIEAWKDHNGLLLNRSRYIIQHAPGATGRALLFNHGNPTYSGLLAANQKFKDALSADPNNQEANLFYAVTRIGAFALEEGGGGGLETLRDVFQAFGMTRNSNEFIEYTSPYDPYDTEYNSPYDTPSQLPGNSPSGEEIRQFLAGPCITLLNGALANLEKIGSSFQTTLTADETGDEAVEIDYGDVLMYKAMLNAGKCLVLIVSSYNINVDTDEIGNKINNDQFSINTDLLDTYPHFLKLVNGGGDTLQSAEAALLDTINSYLAASTSIRAEPDNPFNDLIAFDPEDIGDEVIFCDKLDELKASLNENRTADLIDNGEHLSLNLNLFFGYGSGPYNLRDFLPRFNRYDDPIAGTVGNGLGNDATLGGILPNYSQADWGISSMSMPWIPLLLLDD